MMLNKEILKKQIIYRSMHRGTKEMDLLLNAFVKKYIDTFDNNEIKLLDFLLNIDDEILYKWYLGQNINIQVPINSVTLKLKNFKL